MFLGSEAWQLRYQRNNKQSGLKNLRCFPACSDPHRLRGFCGNSVSFKLPGQYHPFTVAFGEFALKDAVTIREGQVITDGDIEKNERVEDLFKPWHRGDIQGQGMIVFNKQKKGWHYSWVSNKHTSDSEHVFRVFLLREISKGSYKCVGVYDSPSFTIFCRRRDKSGVDNLPPQFLQSSRTSGSEESDNNSEDESPAKPAKSVKPLSANQSAKRQRASVQVEQHATKAISPVLPAVASLLSPPAYFPRSLSQPLAQPLAQPMPQPMHHPMTQTIPQHASSPSPVPSLPSLANEYAVVFRILAALTNVHDRQMQQNNGNIAQGTADGATNVTGAATAAAVSSSSSSIRSAAVPSMIGQGVKSGGPTSPSTIAESDDPDDAFDISKAINECWDWIGNDSINGTQFYDSFFSQPSARPVEEVLLRLGQYLIKEDFFRDIEEVYSSKGTDDRYESKRLILGCLKEKFEKFFRLESTTLDRFDLELLAQNPQLTVERADALQLMYPSQNTRMRFTSGLLPPSLPGIDTLLRSNAFRIVPGSKHDFTGHWRRPASTLEILEKIRSIIGFSWLERKLLLQMEQEFFIFYDGNTMFVRGQRKLAGSNTFVHVIDGVDYPIMLPNATSADHTPTIGLFTRTWACDEGINFCITYTPEYRTVRRTKRSKCGNILESTISLERNDSCQLPGQWVEVLSLPIIAERVTSY